MIRKLLTLFLCCIASSAAFSQVYHNEWIDYSKTYYKFKVFGFGIDNVGAPITKGIVRVPFSAISASGLANVPAEDFQLWRDGEEVPLYVTKTSGALGASDYIEFWGEINNGKLDKELYRNSDFQLTDKWSLQTDTAAYFFTANPAGNNKRITPVANNVAGNTLPPAGYFMYTAGRYFRTEISNGFSAVAGQNLYSSSYDRGEGYTSRRIRTSGPCSASPTLPQSFTNLKAFTGATAPSMRLNINAVGAGANSRSVKVVMNNQEVSLFQMDYFFDAKVEEFVSVDLLQSDAANFVLTNQSTAPCDEFRVAQIELTYPRQFDFGNASVFEFQLDPSANGRYLEISNFSNSGVAPVLFDLQNGKRYVGDISTPGKIKIALEPSTEIYKLVLTTQAGTYYKPVTSVETRNFVNYGSAANQGNYLIISNPLIYGTGAANYVEQYKAYRNSVKGGSYNAQVVDINELVDQFAWGIKKHPLSIKGFLKYARNNFGEAPKSVFLIGKGVSYNDYRANESNPLIEQLNLVPTFGYPASDNLLSSNDEIAIPATPIGRLSAVTAEEIGDYLEKVKQYEAAQQSTEQTIAAKDWMKNVLQIAGANDVSLGNQLEGYMNQYKDIIKDTAFGARVTTYSKTSDPGGYNDALISFKNTYEKGASLITYFGHSSATSLDFNLDDPQNYNNQNKYPVFIANGCTAGNHFSFEANRFNNKTTISERFVLAPERGAIGYLASTHFGVVNYLDLYTKEFYKAFGKTKYNRPIGEAIQEGITQALSLTGLSDYYSRLHSEEYAFHGDPAIKLNASSLPDYVIEQSSISAAPEFVTVGDTTFKVKIKVNNIGRATEDSIGLRLNRTFPDGTTKTVYTKNIGSLYLEDSVLVELPIISNRDKGSNILTATIDYPNALNEMAEYNNGATKNIEISEDEIRPVHPYNFSVVSQPNLKLSASTVNPFNAPRNYVMQIDTTELFNSPLKVSKTVMSAGGLIEFDPAFSFVDNRTYYWRVAPGNIATPRWNTSSFVYRNAAVPAMEQSHVFQNFKSSLEGLEYDSASRKYSFLSNAHNLFITHSIYPTSGLEDSHFSISVDGNTSIASACIGSSVIFNVFDSLTFAPMKNETNPFGAANPCAETRKYNFEYSYRTAAERKNALDFLNSVPSGSFVAVRLVLDEPHNIFAADWAKDSVLYGSANSLYHRLKSHGFATIDSFNRPRAWAFVFKKGDNSFAPVSQFTEGIFDRITLSVDAITPGTKGTITSPKFGPAKDWTKVVWTGSSLEAGADDPTLDIIGVNTNNEETLLVTVSDTNHEIDLTAVSAADYPFIKLRLNNKDAIKATPYQLSSWKIEYEPVPEGGLAPNLHFVFPDTVGGFLPSPDSLKFSVAFKNAGKVNFDALNVKLVLYDSNMVAYPFVVPQTKPIAAGDTIHVAVGVNIMSLNPGKYNVYLQVNPNNLATEQHGFNNFMYRFVQVNKAEVLPVTLVNFNAAVQGDNVNTTWKVTEESNIKTYVVEHSVDGARYKAIGKVDALNSPGDKDYSLLHTKPAAGKNYYRLLITGKDGESKYSATRLVNINKDVMVSIYPNPVKGKLNISLSGNTGKPANIRLINTIGQVMSQQPLNGSLTIDMSRFSPGTYTLQVDDGVNITSYKIQKQ